MGWGRKIAFVQGFFLSNRELSFINIQKNPRPISEARVVIHSIKIDAR